MKRWQKYAGKAKARREGERLERAVYSAYGSGFNDASKAYEGQLQGLFGTKLIWALEAIAREVAEKEILPHLSEAAHARQQAKMQDTLRLLTPIASAYVQNATVSTEHLITSNSVDVQVGVFKPARYAYRFGISDLRYART